MADGVEFTPASKGNVSLSVTPSLSVLTRKQLTELAIPVRVPLLGDWLTERHPCMVYAQTGQGKSLFSMSVAMAVASGGRVFGWQAPKPRPVLYVDAEMDRADIKVRDGLLAQTVDGGDEGALNRNLHMLTRHGQPEGAVFPDLVEPAGQKALLALVQQLKPALVILDNLSTLAEIRDENDASAFGPVLKMLWSLRQLGCAVLLVHHTGKNGSAFRGSSKLAATFESIIKLDRSRDIGPRETGFVIQWDKFRASPDARGNSQKVQLTEGADGAWSWVIEEGEDQALFEVVKRVRSRDYEYDKDIAEALGLSPVEMSRLRKRAILGGLITDPEWRACLLEARSLVGCELLAQEDVGPEGAGGGDD